MAEASTPAWVWADRPLRPGGAVIFDMDGVLSDAARRQHFLSGPSRDWDAFFEACGDDPVIEETARLLELLDSSLLVVLVTARPLRVQPQTLAWLRHNQLRWDLLVMRNPDDHALARDFKRSAVSRLREDGFDLRLAFEDDPRNLEMYRSEGVPCIYLHSGYYER